LLRISSDLTDHIRRGGTVLVPTRARVHAVRLAHASAQLAAMSRVWASPDVLTGWAWARRECERCAGDAPAEWPRVLGATEEWLLWRQAARESARHYPILDSGALAESLQRSSARASGYGLRLPEGARGSEADLLYTTQQLFAARCRELNAASVSALLPRLPGAAESVLVRGYDALPPHLASIARAAAPKQPDLPPCTPRGVRIADAQSQLEAIAHWCRERLGAQPGARLMVMLPGPAGARERLAALIRQSIEPAAALSIAALDERSAVAIEEGRPFGALELPSQALASLALLAGAELDVDSLGRWLNSACWTSPKDAPRAALALLLRDSGGASLDLRAFRGVLQLAPRELRPAARELDVRLQRAVTGLGAGGASPRRWSERFEAALGALGWPGELPPGCARQALRLRWRELLEEFGELAPSVGSLGREAALELLRALALRTLYRPAEGQDAAVTISPLLADPVVTYDGIWVGSLSADVLPQPVTPDPFLPLSAQLEAGMPEASARGRCAQAQALLAAWRQSTGELVLSVPEREGDLELLPSPCLADVVLEPLAQAPGWLAHVLQQEGCTEAIEDVRGTSFNPLTPLTHGTRALTLQNACAFRAYAELRLGATPPQRTEPGVSADQRGLLLHAALQALWERLRSSEALAALERGTLDALIEECVAQAAHGLQGQSRPRRRRARRSSEGQFDLFSVLSPALTRECRRAAELIRRLCDLERTRAPFTVEATEQVMELALGGGRVRLRLDRVDRTAAGLLVLDYKSGHAGTPEWLGERPSHPQLLAYMAALGSAVIALATVNLTAREVRFSGVAAAADVLPRVKTLPAPGGTAAADWHAQQRSWIALIERLIRTFLSGDARVDPAPGACDYCHLGDVCRIGAHLAPAVPDHVSRTDE
jgi:ATP-dependent helicase/nuclease subunit B